MKRILKFTLQQYGKALQPMPAGAKVLAVDNQNGAIQLWVEADTEQPLRARLFLVLYTGDTVPEGATYLGTVLSPGAAIVWHVYELTA